MKEDVDGIGDRHTELAIKVLNLRFELRINSDVNICSLGHKAHLLTSL